MVFASFTPADKQAFFALLDEYFESRPHLLAGVAAGAATNEAKRQISANGPAIASFARSQLTHQFGATSGSGPAAGGPPKVAPRPVSSAPAPSANASSGAQDESEESAAPMSIADRLAAFGGRLNPGAPGATPPTPPATASRSVAPPPPVAPARPGPPAVPRRTSSTSASPPPGNTTPSGLVSSKSFGKIDTTSKMSAFVSMNKSKKEPASGIAPPVPSAFPDQKKRDIAPPPVRRVGAAAAPSPPAEEEEAEEETAEGEWGEMLYEYESEDPNDLNVVAHQRVWITERTSEDWWTGQIDGEGKSGLFPSSYVRLL